LGNEVIEISIRSRDIMSMALEILIKQYLLEKEKNENEKNNSDFDTRIRALRFLN
jgi:hypothetical protein